LHDGASRSTLRLARKVRFRDGGGLAGDGRFAPPGM